MQKLIFIISIFLLLPPIECAVTANDQTDLMRYDFHSKLIGVSGIHVVNFSEFSRDPQSFKVKIKEEIKVFLGVAYHLESDRNETWQGRKLMDYNSSATEKCIKFFLRFVNEKCKFGDEYKGKTDFDIKWKSDDRNYHLVYLVGEEPNPRIVGSADLLVTNFWNYKVFESLNLFDADTGKSVIRESEDWELVSESELNELELNDEILETLRERHSNGNRNQKRMKICKNSFINQLDRERRRNVWYSSKGVWLKIQIMTDVDGKDKYEERGVFTLSELFIPDWLWNHWFANNSELC